MGLALRHAAIEISLTPATFAPHPIHSSSRQWMETNCYTDLWIELLHGLGFDPIPSLASALSTGFDGVVWSFQKMLPEDLRRLYGLEVTEENPWRSMLMTILSGRARGMLHTVEVDGMWLPDTLSTAYHASHVKTTIVPIDIDPIQRTMTYFHNSGLYCLADRDFDNLWGIGDAPALGLGPYVEQIRLFPDRAVGGSSMAVICDHLARRAPGNPVAEMAVSIREAMEWLPDTTMECFHLWAFATLRACGSSAEFAADVAGYAERNGANGAGAACEPFIRVAAAAKAVQFKMARAARGRKVDLGEPLEVMIGSWDEAMTAMVVALES